MLSSLTCFVKQNIGAGIPPKHKYLGFLPETLVKKPLKHKNGFLFKRSLTAIVVLLLFCIVSTASAQTSLPAEDIAEKALAATVYLKMMDKHGKTLGIGSGFFVQPNLIATNYHVIGGTAKGTAKLVGKNTNIILKALLPLT